MEKKESVKKENRLANGFNKGITTSDFTWLEHITTVDLCNKNLIILEDSVKFPQNLVNLNLSRNKLIEIPSVVLKLEKLQSLDLSYNELKYFDETPSFCHTIEVLNLSHNCLCGPPYWVWRESPAKLIHLDLSFNTNLSHAFTEGYYFEELLQYATPVVDIKINNCCLKDHLKLISTFPKAKTINLGSEILSHLSVNKLVEAPCIGLETCCDIESLNLSNTHVYSIKSTIDIFSCLVELNLSHNYLADLPPEFCNLKSLETCILSQNNISYLPDDIGKLRKLVTLRLDSNHLCLLPKSIGELSNLQQLDVYNNCLYEIPEDVKYVAVEVDYAQNYYDEPDDAEYVMKKEKLRLNTEERLDGSKVEPVMPDSEHSPDTSDDESYLRSISNNSNTGIQNYDPPSSPEDWDSDDYWIPRFCGNTMQTPHMQWLHFVKKKMDEGNFCPADIHTVPIEEKVEYMKLCTPLIEHESDGQFDDFSDDDS